MDKKSFCLAFMGLTSCTMLLYGSSSYLVNQKGYHRTWRPRRFLGTAATTSDTNIGSTATAEKHLNLTKKIYTISTRRMSTDIPASPTTVKSSYTTEYSVVKQQTIRQNTLKQACSKLQLSSIIPQNDTEFKILINNTRLFFSDKYKLIACQIPKVGCTNFKKVLLVAEGLVNETNPKELSGYVTHNVANRLLQLKNLRDVTEIRRRLDTYYKVVMVREPLHRILSAYRNKFQNPENKYYMKIAKEIHSLFSSSKMSEEKTKYILNFGEFLRYLNSDNGTYITDPHWDYYHKLCSPCTINYDFVAKLETVDDDMKYVMKTVGIRNITYPQNYPVSQRTTNEKLAKYFKGLFNVTKNLISKYRYDYELFGYQQSVIL